MYATLQIKQLHFFVKQVVREVVEERVYVHFIIIDHCTK